MPAVGVTEREYDKAPGVFRSAALACYRVPEEEEALAQAIRELGLRHVIVGARPYRKALYEALPRGAVIARFGVGHDNIDKAAATQAGLLCTNTPGTLDQSVVEHTLVLLLAAARRLLELANGVKQGDWSTLPAMEVAGKTLVVVGCGAIGRAVARAASRGLQMRVLGVDTRSLNPGWLRDEYGIAQFHRELEPAVRQADFVSLHVPGGEATRHLINARSLEWFQPHAWLINTSRGSVVDEIALYDALARQRLGGAALDVYEREPYEPLDPARDLRLLRNVILTPHCASNTQEANERMARRALHNIELAEARRYDEMDLLNPEVLDTLHG